MYFMCNYLIGNYIYVILLHTYCTLDSLLSKKFNEQQIDSLLDAHVEYEQLDFKEDLDLSSLKGIVEIAKDIAAMSNTGGGYIIIGVDDNFIKKGLDLNRKFDDSDLRNKINKYFQPKINFSVKEIIREINGIDKKFIIFIISPASEIVIPFVIGNYTVSGKTKSGFNPGDILIRDGSISRIADAFQVRQLIDNRIFNKKIESKQQFISSINKVLDESSKPDQINETLFSNLYQVNEIPKFVWEAKSEYRSKSDVYNSINQQIITKQIPSFILRDGKLFSFDNLESIDNPLRLVIDSTTVSNSNAQLFLHDVDKRRWLIELLHISLKNFCISKGLRFDNYYGYFYSSENYQTKKIKWKASRRKAERQVVSYYRKNEHGFYLHNSVRIKFLPLGPDLFLQIDPHLIFTFDGRNPVKNDRFHRLATRLNHSRYNQSILNDIRFWMSILSDSQNIVRIGHDDWQIIVNTQSTKVVMNVGIDEKNNNKNLNEILVKDDDIIESINELEFSEVDDYE